jgi:hypothetical protein
MDKKYLQYAGGVLAAILFLQFVIIPFISRQTARRTINNTLNSWLAEDSAAAMKNFVEPNASPPVYGLKAYKIKSQKFYSVNGKPAAQFLIELDFKTDNVFPSGKVWTCEMTTDKGRWLASSFKLLDN